MGYHRSSDYDRSCAGRSHPGCFAELSAFGHSSLLGRKPLFKIVMVKEPPWDESDSPEEWMIVCDCRARQPDMYVTSGMVTCVRWKPAGDVKDPACKLMYLILEG